MDIWSLNLRHLRAAVETGRLGSINAAADAVSLTQPAVTQALARLEAGLGLPLFERRHDGVVSTAAASLFLPRAETALAHIASARVTMAQVRALLAFANAGSYPAASAATGLAQPSLHRAVNDLAVALRRSLLERRGKGLMLTEAGARMVRAFRLACAELEAGLSEIEGVKGYETGQIVIGAMPLSRARVLPAAITTFRRAHGDVRIRLIEGSYGELVEPLRDGEIDLMIGALRDGAVEDLEQSALFEDRPVVIGRKRHPVLAQPEGASLAALAQFPWTVSAQGTPLRAQWQRMFAEAGMEPPPVPIECGSVMMIRQILVESDFLTLLSRDQVSVELEAGWLDVVCEAPPSLVRSIGITRRSGWRPTAKQAAFLTCLEAAARA